MVFRAADHGADFARIGIMLERCSRALFAVSHQALAWGEIAWMRVRIHQNQQRNVFPGLRQSPRHFQSHQTSE